MKFLSVCQKQEKTFFGLSLSLKVSSFFKTRAVNHILCVFIMYSVRALQTDCYYFFRTKSGFFCSASRIRESDTRRQNNDVAE